MMSRCTQTSTPPSSSPSSYNESKVKHGFDFTAARMRRSDLVESVRRTKREDSLKKRRQRVRTQCLSASGALNATTSVDTNDEFSPIVDPLVDLDVPQQTEQLLAALNQSSNFELALSAAVNLRRLVSLEQNPLIDRVVALDVVPRLVRFLSCAEHAALRFEAAWILTNIVSSDTSDHTNTVIRAGAVPMFIDGMRSRDTEFREQCVWAIGNIIGDSVVARNTCLKYNALPAILEQFFDAAAPSLTSIAAWALSNVFRSKPSVPMSAVTTAMPFVARLIMHANDTVVTEACWTLSHISDGSSSKIQVVVDSGVVPRLVMLLSHESAAIRTAALRTVGNIVTGNAQQTASVVDANPIPALSRLLCDKSRKMRQETCWTLSNITAGTQQQLQVVISAGLMQPLSRMLRDEVYSVKKEACWAIANAVETGSHEQVRTFITPEIIAGLAAMLETMSTNMWVVALDACENILAAGDIDRARDNNIFRPIFESTGATLEFEKCIQSPIAKVRDRAISIMELYFENDIDDDDDYFDFQSTQLLGSDAATVFDANTSQSFDHISF